MSEHESFDDVVRSAEQWSNDTPTCECHDHESMGSIACYRVCQWLRRLKEAHERELHNGSYAYMRKVRDEHLTELERAKEFYRGYRAGQRAMDAERQAIALKLRGLDLTGSSHENLSKMAYAIYPCATGWTAESCEGLRDKLVRLLGGVNERETTLTTYDVLDNERHKAIAELRRISIDALCDKYDYVEVYPEFTWSIGQAIGLRHGAGFEEIIKRLIHLLGGNSFEGGNDGDGHQCCGSCAASGDTDVDEHAKIRSVSIVDELREFKGRINAGLTPEMVLALREMDNGHSRTCPKSGDEVSESAPSVSIVDELREFKGRINAGLTPEMVLALRAEINCIADRIDEQLKTIRKKHDAVLQSTIDEMGAELSELMANNGELAAKYDELQVKLDEIAGVLGG